MDEQIKVLVIEDHPIVRDGCLRIFARRPDIEALEANSAEAGRGLNRDFAPDIVVLDINLPDANGLDLITLLLVDNPGTKIIVFSMYEAASFVTHALEKGALGYITKSDDPASILAAIDKVRAGTVYLGRAVAQNLALYNLEAANSPLRELSDRERQVLGLLGDGKSLTEISSDLTIGYKTAANLVSAIKQKLAISTSSALIKFAVEQRAKL
jgi:two-component system, NarL family, invasion response regulator UvrY